jgi:FAD/FMN-containing dehydrogenase
MPTVNDVTQINPIEVFAIATPRSITELQETLRNTTLPISIGGGHFSMGGHTASPGSLHLDMRHMNRVLSFNPDGKSIRVQAGIRWCDIQHFIDPHGLSVKIMQTYANFTVGGALSVNAHGRYMGLGPVVLSVRNISLVLASGEVVQASPSENSELFYAAIGGYGAIGIIAEAELDLVNNVRVERQHKKMQTADYLTWFDANVRGREDAVFHNADLYPPHYSRSRAVTWVTTDKPATTKHRLQPLRRVYPLERYFMWTISETPLGKFRREFMIDPMLYLSKKVHWRNYEAGYDVAELEPVGRRRRTYVLQEYFVPWQRLMEFIPKMTEILNKHRVNTINISIRHALADPGTLMSWARGETFAFVLYYKQRTRDNAKERVAVWTAAAPIICHINCMRLMSNSTAPIQVRVRSSHSNKSLIRTIACVAHYGINITCHTSSSLLLLSLRKHRHRYSTQSMKTRVRRIVSMPSCRISFTCTRKIACIR